MFRHSQFFLLIILVFSGCKPASSSKIKDAATTTSFKTGAFVPRTPSEFEVSESVQPIGTKEFVDRARQLAKKPDLKLAVLEGLFYAVVTNGSSEQLLVTASADDVPTPQISISGDQLYAWHQLVIQDSSSVAVTDLFVRWPYGKELGKYKPEDMYVRREAWTAQGSKEPLLVPWLAHIKSETSDSIVFQAGNSILDARTGQPIMEFRRIENKPVWYVVGNYADKDVSANTVFWRLDDGSFRSYTKDSPTVTIWKKQDGDSLDRVSTKPKSEEPIPVIAKQFLESVVSAGENQEIKDPLRSYDSAKGDKRIFQLLRNKLYRDFESKASNQSGEFALAGDESTQDAEEELSASDFTSHDSDFSLGGLFSKQTPVRVSSVPGTSRDGSQTTYQQARWEDKSGQPQAGIVLSQRNVFQPAGWFTKEKYVMHNTVRSTDGMIREVDQYGNVHRTMSPTDYRSRARVDINIDRLQREGGVDSRVMRESNRLAGVSTYQLQRSESLLPGKTTGEMAARLAGNLAVGQVTAQLGHGLDPRTARGALTTVGSGVVGGFAKDAIAGKSTEKMAWGSGERFLTSSAKAGGNAFFETIKDVPGVGSAPKAIYGASIDTGMEAFKRRADFDPKASPDYAFDSATSRAALFMPAVSTAASEVFTFGMPKTRGTTAAKTFIKDGVSTLGNQTEALSRAMRANTTEWERSNLLEGVSQRRRDATAATEGLTVLDRLGK